MNELEQQALIREAESKIFRFDGGVWQFIGFANDDPNFMVAKLIGTIVAPQQPSEPVAPINKDAKAFELEPPKNTNKEELSFVTDDEKPKKKTKKEKK